MPESLRSLSDHELLSRTRALTLQERKLTLRVLLYLNEVERRQLHLAQGHGTIFDYCTAGLGYSASAAMRRIQAARCIARFPEVHELLSSNDVNLSTVCIASKVLTPENKSELLARIRGKSQREVEAIVAEFEPRDDVPRERVRTVVVRVPVAAEPTPEAPQRPLLGTQTKSPHTNEYYRNGNSTSPAGESPTPQTILQRRTMIQFSADEAFMAKVARVRSIAWHRLPANASFEELFELALDHLIKHEDPEARHERRETRAMARTRTPRDVQRKRHIPARVRDDVFVRDQGRCSFVGANGTRCTATQGLQADHVHPVARGGSGTADNLRLLCAQHNRFEAERLMGLAGRRHYSAGQPGRDARESRGACGDGDALP